MRKKTNHFNRNSVLLKKENPKLAYQLMMVDPSSIEFCYTKSNELNLKRTYQNKIYYYHSQDNAEKEEIKKIKELNLQEKHNTIFVYGLGLGNFYKAIKDWLNQDSKRSVVFLEEDLSVIHRFLETELATEFLKNPQVEIVYFTDLNDTELFNELSWKYLLSSYLFSALSLYEKENAEGYSELKNIISQQIEQKKDSVDEYEHYGVHFFRNFYPNLLELPHSYRGNAFYNQFKNVPAIICGAGPSLNKNIHLLKDLKNCLIFAGSSALPAVLEKNIVPHFSAMIDPNHYQTERIKSAQKYKIPFFYRNRLFHDALLAIASARLYISGSGGYDVSDWFEKELGIEGEDIDEGHNVVNFCTEIALALGCNPIIFVGLDLALTGDLKYAEGIDKIHIHTSKEEEKEEEEYYSKTILWKDFEGKPIKTFWKWIAESKWISKFAENHPDSEIINATEGGLGIKNVPNKTLKETIEALKQKKDRDLRKEIDHLVQNHPMPKEVTKEKIISLMTHFQMSLKKCTELIDGIIAEIERLLMDKKRQAGVQETPTMLLLEDEIQNEIGCQYLLDNFNVIFMHSHLREIKQIQSHKTKLSKRLRTNEKLKLHKRRYEFLKNVADLNDKLITHFLHI